MKKILFLLVLASLIIPVAEARDVYVDGYYRSDGRYVEPHYRSSPNSTQSDNWGTKGNTNPYTGAPGTKNDNTYNPYRGLR
jgi:opacity protein-like surface antigen